MEAAGLDFALMVFEHTGGAERAYADAPPEAEGIRWSQEVAFVEHHRHDRIVVRGVFAGRYVDADDDEQFIGSRTVEGALGGAAAGALFGPTGLVAGFRSPAARARRRRRDHLIIPARATSAPSPTRSTPGSCDRRQRR